MGRPGLDAEVDAFPQPLERLGRVGVGGEDLIGHAAHEAGIEPAARDHVDHRHFLGDAHRVGAVGHRVAEDADARPLGLAREDRGRERRGDVGAGGGLVMLVEHDVEAELVGEHVLVEVAMVEVRADLGIIVLAGNAHPDRIDGVEVGEVGIGHLGEVPAAHVGVSL